ncbi:MAG TPA: hypothetical protein VGY31_13330 [Terriglobia bacterium]|nr:hypothetical protein [Terriglobia bacterium]
MDNQADEIKRLLEACTETQRRDIFDYLRREFPIHPLETKLNTQAEVILEAIARASDLTLRGIRGVIAEAAFELNVVARLPGWQHQTLEGDFPYDFLLRDSTGDVRIQVKMQRLKDHRPMLASQGYSYLPSDMYVVETQRTRGGVDPQTKQQTRPYRFGEFDILAVSMHPSTNDWSTFMYTVSDWLIPRPQDAKLMLKFQPVAKTPDLNWTDDLNKSVSWLRSGMKKRIWLPHQDKG